MAELHKNQVAWVAAKPASISLAKKEDFVGPALQGLAEQTEAIAKGVAAYQNNKIKESLESEALSASSELENAQSATANYELVADRAKANMMAKFNEFGESTKKRFLRDNPTFFERFELGLEQKVVQKKGEQLINATENKLPEWTSKAIASGDPNQRKDVVKKIQQQVGPYSMKAADELIFKANVMMDNANLANLLSRGDFSGARELLKNVEQSHTIDAMDRSVWLDRITAKEKEYKKLKEETKQKIKDQRLVSIIDAYNQLKQANMFSEADKLRDDVYKGNPISMGWIESKASNGAKMCVPAFIDISDLSPTERSELVREIDKYENLNPEQTYANDVYQQQVTFVLGEYEKFKDAKSSQQTEAILELMNLVGNKSQYKTIESATRKKIAKAIDMNVAARAEAAQPSILTAMSDVFYDAPFLTDYRDLSPQAVIRSAIQGQPVGRGAKSILHAAAGQTQMSVEDAGGLARVLGKALATDVKNYKDNFESDMERDSLAEYGRYHISLINSLRGTKEVTGGIGALSRERLEKAWIVWAGNLRKLGTYNSVATEENRQNIDSFYEYALNRKPNESERETITKLKEWAAIAQPDAKGDFGKLLQRQNPEMIINVTTTYPNSVARYIGVGDE